MFFVEMILGLFVWAGQIFAIIACFSSSPKKRLRILGGIGAILMAIAMAGSLS